MRLASDKKQHAMGGAIVALATVAVLAVAVQWGIAWAMFAGSAGAGIAFEVVQKIRREGEPDWRDAVATAAGGAVVAVLWHFNWPILREILR